MIEFAREEQSMLKTFMPFPELPPMSLRLFGVAFEDHVEPRTRGGEGWEAYRRYRMFRRGVAELLHMPRAYQESHVTNVTLRILEPRLSPRLMRVEPRMGLTYYGEIIDTPKAHTAVRRLRDTPASMNVIDILYAVTQGDMPEAWQQLHDQTARLAQQAVEE